ncbi:DUF1508 domain-containing protein [Chryseobacterium indoltheticum]|uniref:YegP family protein n=1 Tax=Chryseobacterium indoltheticum TaxID=254 RepID=UPI0028ED39DF|nr:DUF1508 domain-containing protein [Chryseobacterium indoltheticum]
MGKFTISKRNDEYQFNFKVGHEEIIRLSEMLTMTAERDHGIESAKNNASIIEVVDKTCE